MIKLPTECGSTIANADHVNPMTKVFALSSSFASFYVLQVFYFFHRVLYFFAVQLCVRALSHCIPSFSRVHERRLLCDPPHDSFLSLLISAHVVSLVVDIVKQITDENQLNCTLFQRTIRAQALIDS